MQSSVNDSTRKFFLAKFIALGFLIPTISSCGGDQYTPEVVPDALKTVPLPLSASDIEGLLASNNAVALIDTVKANQSDYEAKTGTSYAKLTAIDTCVKRVPTPVSPPLSRFLYWDEEKNGFFNKTIAVQKPVLTKFSLAYAVAINTGDRVPVATTFEFPLIIESLTNPSGDYKNFIIEAYPYWTRDYYVLKVPVGAFVVYPKKGSGTEYAILSPASNSLIIDLCPS
ncbi:MAG: hypothetical protein EBT36_02115 [Betaproteobacteria bacterium]|nr:hypothetical protein [Betaproteobacteria bacterium]